MAKKNGGNGGGTKMTGPMYTPPSDNLDSNPVSGPKGGKSIPDPIGLTHGIFGKGPGAKGAKDRDVSTAK